jgi:Flp pilus assembly protein protease CpaA
MNADVAVVWLGATGFRDGMLGFGLCALIGIISFIARGIGGGDTKLLAAVGAMLGLAAVTPVLFNTLLIAAVIGLLNWALNGTLVPRMQVVATNLLITFVTKRDLKDVYPFGRTEAPFGLSLLLGLASAQFVAVHELLLKNLL